MRTENLVSAPDGEIKVGEGEPRSEQKAVPKEEQWRKLYGQEDTNGTPPPKPVNDIAACRAALLRARLTGGGAARSNDVRSSSGERNKTTGLSRE